ncbi:MMPL family transporter [Paenibacillus sp. LMG 31458]|uniref:MMPL family transporter n=1 Tax=Paenibacillus phytorum TaxID=2654977 RepID=A0ABX1Y5G9_9BACL|nr:MMPL family transporter [Paenibacillus phytorum]NOU75854.1 MMPL family transporter [Paenibacillus phytorum]
MDFQKLAIISLRYPKAIILVWTLFLIFFGFYAPKLPTVLKDHGLLPNGAYVKVEHTLSSDFHVPEDPVILVFEKKEFVSPEQFQQFIQQTLFPLKGIDGLSEMVSPLQREGMLKGNFAYALLAFKHNSYEMKPVLDEIHRRLPNNRDISVKMTGKSVVQADVNRASQNDLRKAERIGIPAAFIILWLAFGGIISAMIPIVIGIIGVTGTMGMMYWLGTKVELSNFVLNVIPMVGFALSIDFALMLVSRFREELQRESAVQALITTMKTAGRAVLFSAASVFLGLMGILFIPLPMFSAIAIGAMTVLTVSVLLTLTLVPVLLSVLWPAIRAESKPLSTFTKRNILYSMSHYVMKRPVRMSLLASFLLITCFLPLNKIKLAIPDAASLPQGYNSRMAFETYQAHFVSQTSSEVYIVVQGKTHDLKKEEWLNAYKLIQKLEIDPYVQSVNSVFSSLRLPPEQVYSLLQKTISKAKFEPIVQQFVKENRMLIHVTLKGEPSSKKVMSWLRLWEQEGESSDLHFLLGGEAKYQQEVFDAIFQNIKFVLLFILVSNYVVLFIAFRSILIPLKTIVMNLLSLGASFGILVWIFEEGHFGMEPNSIAIMIPVFIFGLAFGISMDYGVFLVSRIFEVYQQTHDNGRAVLVGLASISRIINSAAAIMIAVTVPFAFGEVVGVKQLGIGIAAAIFIDATVIRMVLVPSLMRMFGKWNWWGPGWLK